MTLIRTSAAVVVLACCCKVDGATVKDHSHFCVRQDAEWRLQPYAPLIDTRLGTEYVQAIYTGKWLQRVLVKRYDKRTELMYEYKFTEDGKLFALHGKLRRWGRWMAEADLYPDADGPIPSLDVKYRLKQDGGVIQAPDDGAEYTKTLQHGAGLPEYRGGAVRRIV